MIQHYIKILIALFLFSGNCYSQTSWNFSLWFNLSDSAGNRITTTEFRSLKAYVPNGVQVSSVIQFDTIADMFELTAASAIPTSDIVFIYKDDTTILRFNSDEPYTCIDSIVLDGYSYDFRFDKSDKKSADKFKCKELLNGYDSKQVCKTVAPVSVFKVEKFLDSIHIDFEDLRGGWIEVKLE